MTRVTLQGGVCPCCAKRFKSEPPKGLEPGSLFGPNLRAFALYLRYSQAISFERLTRLMSDLLGLEISEGALNNVLDTSRSAFAAQVSLFVFVTNRELPATNNGSEQALRPCVTFRKVANCFRSQWCADLYADVRSVIETARRRAVGALEAIRLTLSNLPLPSRQQVPIPTG